MRCMPACCPPACRTAHVPQQAHGNLGHGVPCRAHWRRHKPRSFVEQFRSFGQQLHVPCQSSSSWTPPCPSQAAAAATPPTWTATTPTAAAAVSSGPTQAAAAGPAALQQPLGTCSVAPCSSGSETEPGTITTCVRQHGSGPIHASCGSNHGSAYNEWCSAQEQRELAGSSGHGPPTTSTQRSATAFPQDVQAACVAVEHPTATEASEAAAATVAAEAVEGGAAPAVHTTPHWADTPAAAWAPAIAAAAGAAQHSAQAEPHPTCAPSPPSTLSSSSSSWPMTATREQQKQLVQSIKATTIFPALKELIDTHGSDMDYISVTTVVTQAALLFRRSVAAAPTSAAAFRQQVVEQVVPLVQQKLPQLDDSGVVNILHKLSVMEVKHEQLVNSLVQSVQLLLPHLKLSLLTTALWSLVHLEYPLDPLLLQQLLCSCQAKMLVAPKRQDLGQLAWALGKLRVAPEASWVEAFISAVLQAKELDDHSVACIAWGLQRMEVQLPAGFPDAFLRRVQTLLPTAGMHALGILAYAAQGLGWVPPGPWQLQYLAAVERQMHNGSSHNLASIGCWVASWGVVPAASWRGVWLSRCHEQLPSCTAQGLYLLARCLAAWPRPPQQFQQQFVSAALAQQQLLAHPAGCTALLVLLGSWHRQRLADQVASRNSSLPIPAAAAVSSPPSAAAAAAVAGNPPGVSSLPLQQQQHHHQGQPHFQHSPQHSPPSTAGQHSGQMQPHAAGTVHNLQGRGATVVHQQQLRPVPMAVDTAAVETAAPEAAAAAAEETGPVHLPAGIVQHPQGAAAAAAVAAGQQHSSGPGWYQNPGVPAVDGCLPTADTHSTASPGSCQAAVHGEQLPGGNLDRHGQQQQFQQHQHQQPQQHQQQAQQRQQQRHQNERRHSLTGAARGAQLHEWHLPIDACLRCCVRGVLGFSPCKLALVARGLVHLGVKPAPAVAAALQKSMAQQLPASFNQDLSTLCACFAHWGIPPDESWLLQVVATYSSRQPQQGHSPTSQQGHSPASQQGHSTASQQGHSPASLLAMTWALTQLRASCRHLLLQPLQDSIRQHVLQLAGLWQQGNGSSSSSKDAGSSGSSSASGSGNGEWTSSSSTVEPSRACSANTTSSSSSSHSSGSGGFQLWSRRQLQQLQQLLSSRQWQVPADLHSLIRHALANTPEDMMSSMRGKEQQPMQQLGTSQQATQQQRVQQPCTEEEGVGQLSLPVPTAQHGPCGQGGNADTAPAADVAAGGVAIEQQLSVVLPEMQPPPHPLAAGARQRQPSDGQQQQPCSTWQPSPGQQQQQQQQCSMLASGGRAADVAPLVLISPAGKAIDLEPQPHAAQVATCS